MAVTGRAQQYKISDAVITADRNGTLEMEVTFHIMEFTVFEDIEKPYITGRIAILDDKGLFDGFGFKGTEKLTLTVSATDSELEARGLSFTHTFFMTSLLRKEKITDKSEMYVFSLIDEQAFIDSTKKISKSYRGKLEQIASRICGSELGLNVDQSFLSPSVQDNVKVVIPYMSPLQAAKWLVNRATTENGSPFFLYSTLYDQTGEGNTIRLGNLDVMLSQTPFNSRIPYIYSASATNVTETLGPEKREMIVNGVYIADTENTLNLVDEGAIGSRIMSKDTFNSSLLNTHHAVGDTIARLEQTGIIPVNTKQTVYDDKQVIVDDAVNPLYLDDMDARVVNTLTSFGTYGKFNSIHDVENTSMLKNKVRRLSINSLLYRNLIDVTIPGMAFFAALKDGGKSVSVGDLVRINFLVSNTEITNANEDEALDKYLSGDYLILRARNTYKGTQHHITLTVTKFNTRPSDT